MSDELETGNNQPASEAAAPTVVPTPDTNVTNAPATNGVSKEQGGNEWQDRLSALEKSNSELRKKLVQQGTEKNDWKKQFETLSAQQKQVLETLAKATEKPYDPDQFMEEFRTQGPNYLQKLLQEQLEKARAQDVEKIQSLESQMEYMRTTEEIKARRLNTEKYPDFQQLEGNMKDIYDANPAVFENMSVEEKLDELYTRAKLLHSQQAIDAAAKLGKKKAEEELATEARSGVAGGGKVTGNKVVDPNTLPVKQHRQYLIDQGLVSGY